MTRLPVVVGFGGVNAAGRSSFHHGYRRTIFDALSPQQQTGTLHSLSAMMRRAPDALNDPAERQWLLDHTLIRRIEPEWFDPDRSPLNLRLPLLGTGQAGAQRLLTRSRYVPDPLPPGWRASDLGDGQVLLEAEGEIELLLPSEQKLPVHAAGLLPSGFEPGKLYASRSHPRGLQMAVFAASDALGCLGLDWAGLLQGLSADQVSVYAGSAMGQLDEQSNGGMLASRYRGKRVTSKHCPFGLAEMPADFVNAYVLGNVGATGAGTGACASFLYNLRQGVIDIQSGRARVAVIGAAEAPVVPDVLEGYVAMGALATDEGLLDLDAGSGRTEPDYRRSSRPFSTNCGFTIAEGAQYVILMDDELALETGASIYGSVPDVFVNADGFKKSIASPGIGNYVTLIKAVACARSILGDEVLRQRSFVHAHGTSTPQNRVSESRILNEAARLFGIQRWPVAAIKAYLGHTLATAAGDQMVSCLGTWEDGWIPGIATIDHVAADVHRSHLHLAAEHLEVGAQGMDVAIVNAKGFGGNNASGTLLAPHVTTRMLERRHGRAAMSAWQARNTAVREKAADYDRAACAGDFRVVYKFDNNVLDGVDLDLSAERIGVPGFGQAISLDIASPYADWQSDG